MSELGSQKTTAYNRIVGEHDQLILQSKDAEEERDRLLKDAETMRELRLQEARALYAYDCKAATESFENTIKDLKSNLISEINEQTKRLEDLRDGVTEGKWIFSFFTLESLFFCSGSPCKFKKASTETTW